LCGGNAGTTPVFYNERVYSRDPGLGGLTLDSATGTAVAQFQGFSTPAFHGTTGFFQNFAGLQARDIFTGTLKWSFVGDGTLSTAPIVVNGVVYIGSTSGKLFALDENTGTNVWTGIVGASVNRPDEFNASEPLTGLGAAQGLIVVPASNLVVAYQTADVTTPPVIYAEDGTNNAAAVYSVSFVRGPFNKTNPNNLSTDQRTRIVLFTSNLGLVQADLGDPSVLVVELAGVSLPVENVGPLLIPGLSTSYIVVRVPDNAPTGPQELRVKLRGAASAPKMLTISP
jgi:outer membrane protein assembly factor BamB